jgi:hypothetical protein
MFLYVALLAAEAALEETAGAAGVDEGARLAAEALVAAAMAASRHSAAQAEQLRVLAVLCLLGCGSCVSYASGVVRSRCCQVKTPTVPSCIV